MSVTKWAWVWTGYEDGEMMDVAKQKDGYDPEDIYVKATDYDLLLERCEKMEAQLEAVKRLAKALTHDPEGCYSSCKECLEASAAQAACLAVGIDPREL